MTSSLHSQGVQLLKQGRYDEAENCFLRLLAVNPYSALLFNMLGICRARKGQYQEALDLMNKALALDANSADVHHNIGPIYRILGDFETAERHYRRAIQLKPTYAEAYFNLASVRKFTADDPAISDVTELLRQGDLSQEDRCFGHFAAGKMLDDVGRYDEAFDHYREGNRLRGVEYSTDARDASVAAILANFTREALSARAGQGSDAETPIFVVGMPRSGTTLVEQILASHPEVFGAGELRDMPSIVHTMSRHDPERRSFPDYLGTLPDNVFRGFGEAYLKRVRGLSDGAARVVDKMPQNYVYLGILALMFPRSRIVHCVRNPLDTCLSCYFQRFRVSQEYSYDLHYLGHYFRGYRRIMDHWKSLLPPMIHEVRYEDLVASSEPVARGLLDHCGLDWDDACLESHRTERPVTTASNLQVRQPVYRTSVRRWKRYEKHLGPLLESIGWDDLSDEWPEDESDTG